MESPRKEESGKAKEDLKKNCRGRCEGHLMEVGPAEGDGPEPIPWCIDGLLLLEVMGSMFDLH